MAGLGGFHGDFNRLAVAHLANQDYFGRLPQRGAQGQRKIWRVGMQLALMNRRVLVRVQKLNRILDRDDVVVLRLVNEIDDRGERRALAAAGRTGHQHDTVLHLDDVAHLRRQIEIREVRRPRRNYAHHDRVCAALLENVHAKAAKTRHAERKVGRPILLQTLGSFFVSADNYFGDGRGLRRCQFVQTGNLHRLKLADQFNLRRAAGREDQVADFVGNRQHLLQNAPEVQGSLRGR